MIMIQNRLKKKRNLYSEKNMKTHFKYSKWILAGVGVSGGRHAGR